MAAYGGAQINILPFLLQTIGQNECSLFCSKNISLSKRIFEGYLLILILDRRKASNEFSFDQSIKIHFISKELLIYNYN